MSDTVARFESLILEGSDRAARDLRALEPVGGAACSEPGGLILYGHLCLLSGRPSQALRCYRDILELEPGHPGASLGRLVALDHLGARTPLDTRAAEKAFRAADETARRLLAPLASAPLRRAAWISVGTSLAAALERRVAGQEFGRTRLVELVTERLEDGQFDECDLTLRDVERVREAFVSQLLGAYHQRIAYPQNRVVELEARRGAGSGA